MFQSCDITSSVPQATSDAVELVGISMMEGGRAPPGVYHNGPGWGEVLLP